MAQIILIRADDGGQDETIKVDFFSGLRWYNVGIDVASERLFDPQGRLDLGDKRVAAGVSFLQKSLTVGRVSERDWHRTAAQGADPAYLTEFTQKLGVPLTVQEVAAHGPTGLAKWRVRATSCGATRLSSLLLWLIRVLVAHLKFKTGFGTKAGMVLSVSGLDGCGKSTLANRLTAAYSSAGGQALVMIHLLPRWVPMPHQLLRRNRTRENYTRPYAEPAVRSRLNGGLRLAYYLIAFALAKMSIWTNMLRGKQILLDRSFFDFAADLTRARIPAWHLPGWILRALMPPGVLVFLDASAENVVARKGELDMERAKALRERYCEIGLAVAATSLDGDKSPDLVFKDLLEYIARYYMALIEADRGGG
jgi:thymidylate kinase